MPQLKIEVQTLVAETEIAVRFNEADPLGVVWHGHYLRYFEDAREAFGKKFGLSYLECYQLGYALPIVKSICEYKRPLRYGQRILAVCKFINSPAAKINFEYDLFEFETRQLVATGSTVQVFVTVSNFEMQLTVPEFFVQWKSAQNLLQ